MEIQRNIMNDLLRWKESKYRKPLVLQGARQVGKSNMQLWRNARNSCSLV
jgi:predicted AAA+ superfamily ATPase